MLFYLTEIVPDAQSSIYFVKSLIFLNYLKDLSVSFVLIDGSIESLHIL